jgi:hypothetical protein
VNVWKLLGLDGAVVQVNGMTYEPGGRTLGSRRRSRTKRRMSQGSNDRLLRRGPVRRHEEQGILLGYGLLVAAPRERGVVHVGDGGEEVRGGDVPP